LDINELIHSINIVEFISQYVDLQQRGDEWWGLSCFKDEKTPSFSVREDPPFFFDYSSGISGNIYTFITKYFKCSSRKAIEIMKEYVGYTGELTSGNTPDVVNVLKKYSRHNNVGKKSLANELSDDYMLRFEKREDKLSEWKSEGISQESLEKFQVRYDALSDRIVYPIKNMDGKIVNIGGRTADPEWKSKGFRKYIYYFPWGTINTIYGASDNWDYINSKREIILFEGCKSVLLADSWGIYNTGAILTSHLSKNQMMLLAKMGVNVVFALDKDVDIRSDKNIQKLKQYVSIYYIYDKGGLLDEKDAPVDKGKEVFEKLYDTRIRLR
jgi:DNA primase